MFKTYVRLPDLLQKRAIEGAHRIGIPTSSHEIYPAALSGGDSVEHTGATSRRGYSTKQSRHGTRLRGRDQIIAKSGMTHHADARRSADFRRRSPTIRRSLEDPRWRLLQPPWTRAAVRAASATARAAGARSPKGSAPCWRCTRRASRIIAGVDSPLTPYATALHIELQDYVTAGLTPFEALQDGDHQSPPR